MKKNLLPLAALMGLSACATNDRTLPEAAAGETAIPCVSSNGIAEWTVTGDDELDIQALNGTWYHVRTAAKCPRLRTALALGFATSGLDQLDRHGAIIAQGHRCAVGSVVKSPAPPKKAS